MVISTYKNNIAFKLICFIIIYGKVAEWFKALAWRASKCESISQVQILSFPPFILKLTIICIIGYIITALIFIVYYFKINLLIYPILKY